jgi:amino-acid N-acetyltransferase
MKIRPATIADAKAICALVNYHAERGRMLHRSLESVYLSLRDFLVADRGGEVIGCAAVTVFWSDLAEIKSLAVAASHRGGGIGTKLVKAAIRGARRIGVQKLFALTYEREFFSRHGFLVVERDLLPEKIWRECIYCPKADACDETAMMLKLSSLARARRAGKAKGSAGRRMRRGPKRPKV